MIHWQPTQHTRQELLRAESMQVFPCPGQQSNSGVPGTQKSLSAVQKEDGAS